MREAKGSTPNTEYIAEAVRNFLIAPILFCYPIPIASLTLVPKMVVFCS